MDGDEICRCLRRDPHFPGNDIGAGDQNAAGETGTDREETALNQDQMLAKPGPFLKRVGLILSRLEQLGTTSTYHGVILPVLR